MLLKGDRGYDNLYTISAVLRCPRLDVSGAIRFIIDIGASSTTIAYKDAIRLGINYDKLKRNENKIFGIGGTVLACSLPKSTLIFLDENQKSFKDDLFHADVLERKKGIVPPSLLGMDILHKFKLRFNAMTAFLEL